MKLMKLLHSLLGLLVLLAFLGGLYTVYSIVSGIRQQKAEREQNTQQWTAQACQNAQAYIQEKYGFQAEILSTEQDWDPGMFGRQMRSNILVRMQYQDKSFDVGIDGRNPNTDGADSYQTEEILNFIRSKCEDALPGVYNIELSRGEFTFEMLKSQILFSTYFNGKNAPELLEKSRIFVRYIQKDLSKLDLSVIKNSPDFRRFHNIMFISFRSEEALQECTLQTLYHASDYGGYAVWFDYIYEFFNNEENYYHYEIGQYQNIYYYVPDGTPEDVVISETEPDDISNWNVHHRAEFASKAWKIETKKETNIYVFIPKSEISGSEGIRDAVRENDSFSHSYIGDIENISGSYCTRYFHLYPDEEFYFLYLK